MSAIPRNEDEAFEDYKARRSLDHYNTKIARMGTLVHSVYHDGTYVNPNRAAIKAERKARKDKRKQLKGI